MIISSFFGIASDDFTKLFTIVIQLGAILSVVVLYFKRFFQTWDFYFKLFVAFIPAVVLGWLSSAIRIDGGRFKQPPLSLPVALLRCRKGVYSLGSCNRRSTQNRDLAFCQAISYFNQNQPHIQTGLSSRLRA
jgi:hypothetical protein